MPEINYIVATVKLWNEKAFQKHSPNLPGKWHLITKAEDLTVAYIQSIAPRYIFFPHWSWKVPEEILQIAECVCFHMADVPYGRGGSPLQNLIVSGHTETKLSALQMVKELDAGPVYLKLPLSLTGSAQEIFERLADLVYESIKYIITNEPQPVAQSGQIVTFKRRTPEMSLLSQKGTIKELYDHIRMLDAETYPPAYLDYGMFRLFFNDAHLDKNGNLLARVRIERKE